MTDKNPSIQQELEKAAGLKKNKTESRPHFLERLVRAVAEVPDPVFNGLSNPARKWYDENVELMDSKKELKDFPDEGQAEEAAPVRKRPAEDSPAPKAEAAAPKKAVKAKAAPKKAVKAKAAPKKAVKAKAGTAVNKPVPATKARGKKINKVINSDGEPNKQAHGGKSLKAIRQMVVKKPNISEQDIFDKLVKDFPDLKMGTVSTTRANARATLKETPEYRDKFDR